MMIFAFFASPRFYDYLHKIALRIHNSDET
jgi:hypothetical protein